MFKPVFLLCLCLQFMSGCCMLAKRSCFPACPPTRVVTEAKCKLPGKIALPAATNTTVNCPSKYVCYDKENAKNLFRREDVLKQWINEARKNNESPSSQPSTTIR